MNNNDQQPHFDIHALAAQEQLSIGMIGYGSFGAFLHQGFAGQCECSDCPGLDGGAV